MSSLESSIHQLPENVVVDILSRLPAKTILHCRSVCKSWHSLLTNSTYFTSLHLSRSPTGLIIHHDPEELLHIRPHPDPGFLKLVEIEDEPHDHNLRHDPTMSLDLNLGASFRNSKLLLVGSVNGLICLWQFNGDNDNTYICNLITREYMILPKQEYYRKGYAIIVYCFGVSSLTGEYKVVRIFEGDIPPDPTSTSRPSLLEGEIYTLGTGKWRSLGHIPYWLAGFHGPFLNGCAHWMVCDQNAPENLCSFDFENESFQLFPSPPQTGNGFQDLGVLGGCLCKHICFETEFVIWVMKEYGIKKSWTKEILINTNHQYVLDCLTWDPVHVIKDLKDGTILIICYQDALLALCPEKITIENTQICQRYLSGMSFTPSFIRLGDFALENVHGF